ncbi:uncharacterized protein [Elaeis guineensis]|uniref:uncharacterized protein n=1 Tax=Elaeis guineensis var. tenera TaxID=51953 RepID=UPI003C6CF1DA
MSLRKRMHEGFLSAYACFSCEMSVTKKLFFPPPCSLFVCEKRKNREKNRAYLCFWLVGFCRWEMEHQNMQWTRHSCPWGLGKFQGLVLAHSGMGWISKAMEMMLLSFVGPAVQLEWKHSPHQESLITSVVVTGMLLGAYSWGMVSDSYGWRQVLLIHGLILSSVIVDRIRRKLLKSTMLFLSCFFIFPLAFHQTEELTTALLFGARICISGILIVVYIYAPEGSLTSVRTTGIGTASSVGRIGGIMCPLVAVGMLHACHQIAATICI